MSAAMTLERPQDFGTGLFKPSIAAENVPMGAAPGANPNARRVSAAFWALRVTLPIYAGVAAPSAAMATLPRPVIVARAAPAPSSAVAAQEQMVAATSQDLVATLKAKGMPVAALSEVLDVERKTIYSWLDEGRDAKPENHERLRVVHSLLAGEEDGSLRFFHRFWERKLPEVGSLKAVLTSSEIDSDAVQKALNTLRPAVRRAMEANAERKAAGEAKSPAASLTLLLRATT